MRRGPGGGLVISAPTLESIIDPVAVYLFYANSRVDQVAEARIALEEAVAELAPPRLTEQDMADLRDLGEQERTGQTTDFRKLHALLAAITRNPALEVFVSLLTRLTHLYMPDLGRVPAGAVGAATHAHAAIIEAVAAGDIGRARHRMRVHLEAEADFLRHQLPTRQLLDATALSALEPGGKRGERVAREIFVGVSRSGWPVGQLLGSEAELMDRYDVSRAVFREAVRLLEHHQVAVMRRGPGGGLFVAEPGAESVAAALALLLERRGIQPGHLFELRLVVELTVVDLAIKRLDDDRAAKLRLALDAERDAATSGSSLEFVAVGHDVHGVLAGMVDNPVFELMALVLIQLTRLHQAVPADPPVTSAPAAIDDVIRAHAAIVEAVLARDVELARHRMRRHLAALHLWVH
jgi:DNA-binding FadR family transcriptional regulator